MKKILFLTFAFCLLPFYFSHAATVYVATNGSDSSGNGTSSAPWRTIQFATRSAQAPAGTTIIVRNGQYNENLSINCGSNATSANSGNPIIVQAENERRAIIHGTGTAVIYMTNCNYWQFVGFIIENTPASSCSSICDTVQLTGSSNNQFRKNILRRSIMTVSNHMALLYQGSNNNLFEDNELSEYERHGVISQISDGNIFRRNYCDGTISPLNPGVGGIFSDGAETCIDNYPGSNTIMENNISYNLNLGELNAQIGTSIVSINNRYFGNISIGPYGTIWANSRDDTLAGMPQNTTVQNGIWINANRGLESQSAKNTRCNNCSFFNTSLGLYVRRGNPGNPGGDGIGDGQSSFFSINSFFFNNSTNWTVSDPDLTSWSIDYAHVVGGSQSPGLTDSHISNEITTSHTNLGRCYIYVENGTPGFNTGYPPNTGVNRGATVLKQYNSTQANPGVLTNVDLWDWSLLGSSRGRFKGGAIIVGVNDGVNSLSRVHEKLNLGSGSCPGPGGVAPLLPTITITTNGGNNFTTSTQNVAIGGNVTGVGF